MPGDVEITVRTADGAVAGRISRAPDGSVVAEVVDEGSRWLVELAARRAGAPPRPRPRPACTEPDAGSPWGPLVPGGH